MNELKTIEITCEKESLLDSSWLFNNIPWSNHDDSNAKVLFDTPIEAYAIDLDGYDYKSAKLKKFTFDCVLISAFHGFAGNTYHFLFKLKDEETHETFNNALFGYSIDDVKNSSSNNLSIKIQGLKYQINYNEISISNIMGLTLDNDKGC